MPGPGSRSSGAHPAGQKAFESRGEKKSGVYSYEQRKRARLDQASERLFRARTGAWRFFQSQPPWYRRTAFWWVISAKKEKTRRRRLRALIQCPARTEPIPELRRPARGGMAKAG